MASQVVKVENNYGRIDLWNRSTNYFANGGIFEGYEPSIAGSDDSAPSRGDVIFRKQIAVTVSIGCLTAMDHSHPGGCMVLRSKPTATIWLLKRKLEASEGLSKFRMSLEHGGRRLNNAFTLAQCEVQDGDELVLNMRQNNMNEDSSDGSSSSHPDSERTSELFGSTVYSTQRQKALDGGYSSSCPNTPPSLPPRSPSEVSEYRYGSPQFCDLTRHGWPECHEEVFAEQRAALADIQIERVRASTPLRNAIVTTIAKTPERAVSGNKGAITSAKKRSPPSVGADQRLLSDFGIIECTRVGMDPSNAACVADRGSKKQCLMHAEGPKVSAKGLGESVDSVRCGDIFGFPVGPPCPRGLPTASSTASGAGSSSSSHGRPSAPMAAPSRRGTHVLNHKLKNNQSVNKRVAMPSFKLTVLNAKGQFTA